MSTEELKRINARCEAATEGPWDECKEAGADIIGNKDTIILEICPGMKTHAILRDNNLQFIAHARKDLPDCLDEIERMRSKVQAILDDCHTDSDEQDTIYFVEECKLYEIIEGD